MYQLIFRGESRLINSSSSSRPYPTPIGLAQQLWFLRNHLKIDNANFK